MVKMDCKVVTMAVVLSLLSMLHSVTAEAALSPFERHTPTRWNSFDTSTVCISGYLFAVAVGADKAGGVTLVQMFRGGQYHSSPAQPILCREE